MVCVQCGQETAVINSRHQKRSNQVWRRRQCKSCSIIFTTEEQIEYSGSWRVEQSNKALRPFSRDKLLISVYASCQHRKTALADAQGLVDTIISKLSSQINKGVVDTRTIIQVTTVALNRFDPVASTHYRAFHA